MKWALIIISVAVALCATACYQLKTTQDENKRLQANQSALMEEIDTYRTIAGNSAADCRQLQLTKDELEATCSDLRKTIDDLSIKLRFVKSAATTGISTDVEVAAALHDTIIYKDTVPSKLQAFSWADSWVAVDGLIDRDTARLQVSSRDTLTQVVYRVPHRFLFIRWGTKAIRQVITCTNPHAEISYTSYIKVIE